MKDKRFTKPAVLITGVLAVFAAGAALVKVRAQITTVQPFVAIMVEQMAPRKDQSPTPIIRFQTIAVRSDGSESKVTTWDARSPRRVIHSREVIDATAKKHTFVEDITQTMVPTSYSDVQVLASGVLCEGNAVDALQGFEIVYSEHPLPSPTNDASLTHKQWRAPKLGCFPIMQEFVGTINGQPMDTKQTLVNIQLGDPDPWYFNVPAEYTARTTEEWFSLMKPMLKQ